MNRERGELIDRAIAGKLSIADSHRLDYLTGYAEAYVALVAPRDNSKLEAAEALIAERKADGLVEAAKILVSAIETCHVCQGTVLVNEGPTHCEDCSWDCEEHDGQECPRLDSLHGNLKRALAVYEGGKP